MVATILMIFPKINLPNFVQFKQHQGKIVSIINDWGLAVKFNGPQRERKIENSATINQSLIWYATRIKNRDHKAAQATDCTTGCYNGLCNPL